MILAKNMQIFVISTMFLILINSCKLINQSNYVDVNVVVDSNDADLSQPDYGISKGQIPPDFTVTTIDNKQYTLSHFRDENKPVLLYFWASWCPYCSQDFSIVKNIYPEYADKVTFLAINLDTGEEKELIEKYKNKKGLNGIDFTEANVQVLSDYAITRTTTKYAIGRNGVILYKGSGVFNEEQWEILLNGLANS